jgi:hypothetical protein
MKLLARGVLYRRLVFIAWVLSMGLPFVTGICLWLLVLAPYEELALPGMADFPRWVLTVFFGACSVAYGGRSLRKVALSSMLARPADTEAVRRAGLQGVVFASLSLCAVGSLVGAAVPDYVWWPIISALLSFGIIMEATQTLRIGNPNPMLWRHWIREGAGDHTLGGPMWPVPTQRWKRVAIVAVALLLAMLMALCGTASIWAWRIFT